MEHVSSIMEREVVLEADFMNQGYGNESLRDWEAVIEGLHRFQVYGCLVRFYCLLTLCAVIWWLV